VLTHTTYSESCLKLYQANAAKPLLLQSNQISLSPFSQSYFDKNKGRLRNKIDKKWWIKLKRQKDWKTERLKDRKTERQKDRETERQKDRKTERQKDRKTERHNDNLWKLKYADSSSGLR
jgi:hypothetical protein